MGGASSHFTVQETEAKSTLSSPPLIGTGSPSGPHVPCPPMACISLTGPSPPNPRLPHPQQLESPGILTPSHQASALPSGKL